MGMSPGRVAALARLAAQQWSISPESKWGAWMLVSYLAAGHDPNSIFGLPAWASIASEIFVVVILIWIIVSLRHRAEENRERRARQSRRPYVAAGRSDYPSDAERLIRDHEIWLEQQARSERQHEDSGKLFKYWTGGG